MDKTELYRLLDIENKDEFRFFENLAALLEEDGFIEEDLIFDLIRGLDMEMLAEHFSSFFDAFLDNLPDDQTDMYMTVDSIGRHFSGLIGEGMDDEALRELASAISRFRKWYVHDLSVLNRLTGDEVSVRDARYDTVAAKLLGDPCDYDFSGAADYGIDGYDVRISDMMGTLE